MKITFRMDENWKLIKRFPNYKISNYGRIKRVVGGRGSFKGRELTGSLNSDGYPIVRLSDGGKAVTKTIHRLVGETFIGPLPKGKETNHIDGDKSNPYVGNLEYITPSENQKHAYRNGLRKGIKNKGKKHSQCKLAEGDVLEIRELYDVGGISQNELAEIYSVSQTHIGQIIRYKRWSHI